MADQDFNIKVVTTADTSGIRQTEEGFKRLTDQQRVFQSIAARTGETVEQVAARFAKGPTLPPAPPAPTALPEGGAVGGGAADISRLIGLASGAVVTASYTILRNINEITQQYLAISKELVLQGEQLSENAQKYEQQASAAKSESDVLKIASSAVHDIESAHKRVVAAQQEELGIGKKIIDSVSHLNSLVYSWGQAGKDAGRINKAALDAQIAAQQQLAAVADQVARGAIRSAEINKEAFARKSVEPLSQAITEVTNKIELLTVKQNALVKASPSYVKDWTDLGERIANAEESLGALIALHNQKRDIEDASLDSTSKLDDKLKDIVNTLKLLAPAARTPLEAFNEGARRADAQGKVIENLAHQWSTLQQAHTKTLTEDISKGPFTAAQEGLARLHEFQKQIAARREEAAEGTGTEVSEAEKKKFLQEEELRQLQRKQALQRSLLPPGADQAEMLKRLGPQGLKEFEATDARIRQLQEKPPKGMSDWRREQQEETDKYYQQQEEAWKEYNKSQTVPEAQPIPGGRAAGPGESQELVNQIEQNRLALEKQLQPTAQPSGEEGTGGPSLIGPEAEAARKRILDQTKSVGQIGPEAEAARKAEIQKTARESQIAQQEREASNARIAKEQQAALIEKETQAANRGQSSGGAEGELKSMNAKLDQLIGLWR